MKQIIQHLRTGETILEELPVPAIQPGYILIQTVCSLVSSGTEKMLVEFSKANLFTKARQQPERVEQVLNKIKSDGLLPTLEAVFNKLDVPLPLGYCNAGIVVQVADDVTEFKVGDRVASNGNHAEFVSVPKNLVVHIPENVSFEEAAFVPVGAIAIQGIRLAEVQLGDHVAVIGLGLIGLLTAQLLKAAGANVIGFDIADDKIQLAKKLNIKAFNSRIVAIESICNDETGYQGVDAVIIAASSKSSDIINQAAVISRKKGKIILVGVTGININRDEFYKKELTFRVSCSYGPGRYDDLYEQAGIDYPRAFVRYTAKRNFESFLMLVAAKQIELNQIISHKIDLSQYQEIYNQMQFAGSIATIIQYPEQPIASTSIQVPSISFAKSKVMIGLIGAGDFTKSTLLPAVKKTIASIKTIGSINGMNATLLARKFNIPNVTTAIDELISDPDTNLIMITTKHDSHAEYVIKGLAAGKDVYVEKPLAINEEQLNLIKNYFETVKISNRLFIGFNRRYSPLAQKAKSLVGDAHDQHIIITINAGKLPGDHWLNDLNTGGGRIVGEACHFFDLMNYFTSSEISEVFASASGSDPFDRNMTIHLKFKNGCDGVIHYLTNGHRSYPKETIEIYSQGKILVLDNFRKLTGYGYKNFSSMSGKQNKGHDELIAGIIHVISEGGTSGLSVQSMINTTSATFAALKSIRENKAVNL